MPGGGARGALPKEYGSPAADEDRKGGRPGSAKKQDPDGRMLIKKF